MSDLLVHPLIQAASGHITDGDTQAAEHVLALAVEAAKNLEAEAARLRSIAEQRDHALFAIGQVIERDEAGLHAR